MLTPNSRHHDSISRLRIFWRDRSIEFSAFFWLGWAAVAGAILAEIALLFELALPSTVGPGFLRLLFLWPVWLAITLSNILFASDLFHGTGLELVPIVGIVGAIIFAGTAAVSDLVRSARDRLRLTIVAVWVAGMVFTSTSWSLVRSAEPLTAGSGSETMLRSMDDDDPSASWHDAIQRVAVHDHTVEIETLLHPGDSRVARPICVAAANAKSSGGVQLATAWVRAIDGEILCGGAA